MKKILKNRNLFLLVLVFIISTAFIKDFNLLKKSKAIIEQNNLPQNQHTDKRNTLIPDMVLVVGGEFLMGNNSGFIDEKPVHKVHIDSFYISKYEITIAQFGEFITASGYKTDADKQGWSWIWNGATWEKKTGVNWQCDVSGNKVTTNMSKLPVIHVSWNDANEYCKWLSKSTGKIYRLPTEAEWEFAAMGGIKGKKTKYSGSDNIDEVAWYKLNSESHVHPVGQKAPNALGIYDMSGNVWEWCADWYMASYYSISSFYNPSGIKNGRERVIRGGSWKDDANHCRLTIRGKNYPDTRGILIGFRVVRQK